MTIALLSFILASAWLLNFSHRRRASRTMYAMSALLFFAVGCGLVPAWLLETLQAPYLARPEVQWSKRNAIVMLGTGTERITGTNAVEPGMFSHARLLKTVELYNDCRSARVDCVIVLSGGDAQRNGVAEAVVYRDKLLKLGVGADGIRVEPDSMNTWQNARFASAILEKYRADRALLVSSGIHLRRSALYFAHFGISILPMRADYLHAVPSALPLAYNFMVADLVLHEYIGIARYHAYNAFGRNPERKLPGEA